MASFQLGCGGALKNITDVIRTDALKHIGGVASTKLPDLQFDTYVFPYVLDEAENIHQLSFTICHHIHDRNIFSSCVVTVDEMLL